VVKNRVEVAIHADDSVYVILEVSNLELRLLKRLESEYEKACDSPVISYPAGLEIKVLV
jgi:hypothetical protein